VLSCAAIAAELREGTELLRAVDPAQPSRHASFEVVFEQSWRMLTPIERDTLARLSAFRGGFAPEAARFVAGASFPVLGALADKSLLRKDAGRLTLHPLVHQLAGLRLEPAARTATAKAHALYFHRLLSESRRGLESADREALRRIETEFENCRVAWRWGIENGAPDLIGRSAPALLHFCDLRDRHGEGLALLREALAAEAVAADRNVEALLLAAAAHLEYRLDRYVEAETTATRAHAGARAGRNAATLALALQVLGSCSLRLGRHLDAREFFRQAHRQAVATNDLRKAGVMLHNEALVENALGETDEALRLYFQALDCFQQVGDVAGEALCFNNIGLVYMTRKEAASARAQFEAALALCDRQGLPATRGLILANLTELAMKSGDMAAATRHAAGAFEIAEATANRALAAWVQLQRARLALAADDSDGARRQLAEATKTALAIERAALQLDALGILAEILTAQGARDCARAVLHFAAEHPSMSVPDRDDIRATIASWPESTMGATCPDGFDLRGLAQRIVVETPVAYAPLIAALRGA
jgi:tetratricopeptide (TPR) repeat protein